MTQKLRVWQSNDFLQVWEKAAQIVAAIEEKNDGKTHLEDLPMSLMPTDVLYDIAFNYLEMHTLLVENQLLTGGYPKQTSTLQ